VKRFISIFLSVLMIFSCFCILSMADEGNALYVSPDGSDENIGTIDEPLATISGAKERAKAMDGSVTVYFLGGNYTIDETVKFNADDKSDLTFTAYNDEKVVFTSGSPITGFEECQVNGVKAFKKDVGKQADFNVLFNETETLSRTRYPESGYLYVDHVSDDDLISTATESIYNAHGGMYAKSGDLKNFKNTSDIVIRILHYWKDEIMTLKDCDVSSNHISFSRLPSMVVAKNDRYFLENVFEELDKPGEWYLDKSDGILYYIPQSGESAADLTLWCSENETMITVDGVDGISFKNIIFRGNGFNIPLNNEGRDCSQAAYDATPCISYINSKDFSIKNCELRDIAACAVYMGFNVQNATVDSCIFDNIGAQAVYIRGENLEAGNPKLTSNINVTNNLISGYGRNLYNAVGVLVIHANTVNISDNEIHDGYYTAISVGWVWGYAYNPTFGNTISNNLIYDIGQGWLSDMGGIYTLGVQPGTVLSGNVIHNVAADPGEGGYGGWGIYLDEGSSEMLVEKNLVYSCGSDLYHLHYGNKNTVRNNIFALSAVSQIRVTSSLSRCQPDSPTATFTNNIIVTDGNALAISHMVDKTSMEEKNNIYWDITEKGSVLLSKNDNTEKVMTINNAVRFGYIDSPVIVDPQFNDIDNFDFTLNSDSPAIKAGFETWDYSIAGTNEGTVIGVSSNGGETDYNTSSKLQEYESAKTFWVKLQLFFEKIFYRISLLFK